MAEPTPTAVAPAISISRASVPVITPPVPMMGMSTSQFISLVLAPLSIAMLVWLARTGPKPSVEAQKKRKAAAAFKPDAQHCLELGVVDGIVPEPEGGAHASHDEAARLLGAAIADALDELVGVPAAELRRARRAKFRAMGVLA